MLTFTFCYIDRDKIKLTLMYVTYLALCDTNRDIFSRNGVTLTMMIFLAMTHKSQTTLRKHQLSTFKSVTVVTKIPDRRL